MIVIRGWVNIQENANSLEKAEIEQIIKKGATTIASFFMLSAFFIFYKIYALKSRTNYHSKSPKS